MTQNLDEDQERIAANEERQRYLRGLFGDDIFQGLATDPPARNSRPLGERIEQDQRKARREARQAEAREINQRAAQVEAKRDAYARVQNNRRAGRPSSDQDERLAAAWALENEVVRPKPTTEKLIDQGRAARRYQPMGDDAA